LSAGPDAVRHAELYDVRDGIRRELDQLRADMERRLDRLEADVRVLEAEHDTDMDALAVQRTTDLKEATDSKRRRKEWTWAQIIAALAAAAAVGALWLQAVAR
jgi:hypothetical protein